MATMAINDSKEYFSDCNLETLEAMLKTETCIKNRNMIRQIMREKKKSAGTSLTFTTPTEINSIQDVNVLNSLLNSIPDYFLKCKIKNQIKLLEAKNSNQMELKEDTGISEDTIEIKELVIDDSGGYESKLSAVVRVDCNMRLVWKMPFKVVRSIKHVWRMNDAVLDSARIHSHFDGIKAILIVDRVTEADSGIYSVTVHSQRLTNIKRSFQVHVLDQNENIASIVLPVENIIKVKEPMNSIVSGNSDHPRVAPRKNRMVQRYKTMGASDIAESLPFKLSSASPALNLVQDRKPEINRGIRRLNRSATTAKDVILTFARLNTDEYMEYGVCVENLSSSWSDGLAFCALIHHFFPNAFDFSKLSKTDRRLNFQLAFETSEKYADISPLLDIEDMMIMERPDWKCVFTYLQCFYKTFRSHPANQLKTL